tara:strand:- start:1299 stop:2981 length:1683 start_codon:yes stop_codon:yes gene_type:complete
MADFFISNEKKQLNQRSLTFNSTNGLSYIQNNKIIIEVPSETCPFFDPSSSYLRCNVKIDLNAPAHQYLVQMDPYLGAQILMKDVRIYNLQGVLLEELVNVNTLANVMESYSSNQNNQQKAGLTSGQVLHNPNQRTWAASETLVEKSRETNSEFNPWFSKNSTGVVTYNTVPISMKLPGGIFSSDKIYANGVFSGLRVEIVLEENRNCFKLLRNATPEAVVATGPEAGDAIYLPVIDHVGAGKEATGFPKAVGETDIFLGWKNNMVSAETCPFCVGERLDIVENAAVKNIGTIASISWGLFDAKNQVKIVLAAAYTPTDDIPAGANVYSSSFVNRGAGKDPSYTVSDVSLVVEQIFPDAGYQSMLQKAMRQKGGLTYDIHCWQNYRASVAKDSVVATVQLNLLQRMAKAIMVVPVSKMSETLANNIVDYGGSRNGISGVADTIQNIQWYYGREQKFQPDRPVEMDKLSGADKVYNGQYLAELMKAMNFFGVPEAHSLLNIDENIVYPRALALMNQVVDLTEGDFQLVANYSAPTEAKLLNCWIAGIRRFTATAEGVVVTY